jgi:hypothetical protein
MKKKNKDHIRINLNKIKNNEKKRDYYMFNFIEYFHSLNNDDKKVKLLNDISSESIYKYLLSDISESRKMKILNLLNTKLPKKLNEIIKLNEKNQNENRKKMIKEDLNK